MNGTKDKIGIFPLRTLVLGDLTITVSILLYPGHVLWQVLGAGQGHSLRLPVHPGGAWRSSVLATAGVAALGLGGVDGLPLVTHHGFVTVDGVSGVGHGLYAAVRQVDLQRGHCQWSEYFCRNRDWNIGYWRGKYPSIWATRRSNKNVNCLTPTKTANFFHCRLAGIIGVSRVSLTL